MTDSARQAGRQAAINALNGSTNTTVEQGMGIRRLAGLEGQTHGGDRDVYDEVGYPEDLRFEDLWRKYLRQSIAKAIARFHPSWTWRNRPDVVEVDEEGERVEGGEFEGAFRQIADRVSLWKKLERADRLARIGRYGVLLIGLADQDLQDLSGGGNPSDALQEPVGEVSGPEDVLFVDPYHEDHADIQRWNQDPFDSKFGEPDLYRISFETPADTETEKRKNAAISWSVHHSRVVHISEFSEENDFVGHSVLEPIWNRLLDLQKVVAGTSEGFWQAGAPSEYLSVDPKVFDVDGFNIDDHTDDLKEDFRAFRLGLQDVFAPIGMDIESTDEEAVDPGDIVDVLISLISAPEQIPRRELIGTETGQRASEEDRKKTQKLVSARQTQFADQEILRPLLEKLMAAGALPQSRYEIRWPDTRELTPPERAEVFSSVATAISDLSAPEVEGAIGSSALADLIEEHAGIDIETEEEPAPTENIGDWLAGDDGDEGG